MKPAEVASSPTTGYQFSYNRRSRRAKEARLAQSFRGGRRTLWLLGAVLLLASGVILAAIDISIGYSLAGVGLIVLMLVIWATWHLVDLPTDSVAPASQQVQLDAVLAASILAKLEGVKTPQALGRILAPSWQWRFVLARLELDPRLIEGSLSQRAQDLERVWQTAVKIAHWYGSVPLSEGVVAVALLLTTPNLKQAILAPEGLDEADLAAVLGWQLRVADFVATHHKKRYYGGIARDWTFGFTPLLNRLGANISRQLESGSVHLNPEVHEPSLEQMVKSLLAPANNSLAIVGETGVGKTTLVYSLADKLLAADFFESQLKYHQVFSLNASTLLSLAQNQGDLENLVISLLNEAIRAKNIILFFDDAAVFFGDQTGEVNLTHIIQAVLEQAAVRLIFAFRPSDWQKLSAAAPQLTSLLSYQVIGEPSQAETLMALEDQVLSIEAASRTVITYKAIKEAWTLADRYASDQALPGRATNLLIAATKFTDSSLVTAVSVQQAVEATKGVKVQEGSTLEKDQLLHLEVAIHRRMVNQDQAVKVVADALRRARAGVQDSKRPVGSFLFLGPTGVGKTELARALAAAYFGGAQKLIQLDMTEYATEDAVNRLLSGSLDQSVSAPFLDRIRRQPFSVLVFDEIEKAHPKVINLMLQLLEEGRLTDRAGQAVSFSDAIVIATSNAGADAIRQRIETGQKLTDFSAQFIDALINRKEFLPELINRFDEIVLFRPLAASELGQIVKLIMAEVNRALAKRQVKVDLTPGAASWLAAHGNDPRLGARPLRRIIQRSVENVVAKRLLSGALKPGQTAVLDTPELAQERS